MVSAVLLGTIRRPEAAAAAARRTASRSSPRSGTGLRLVGHDPVLRAFVARQLALSSCGASSARPGYLFVADELGLGPAAIGLIAAVGGIARSSAR